MIVLHFYLPGCSLFINLLKNNKNRIKRNTVFKKKDQTISLELRAARISTVYVTFST